MQTSRAEGSLWPVSGEAATIERLLRRWLDEPAGRPLWVRTSGTTGEPKDVALSAAAIRASAVATLARIGGRGQWLLALPAQHVAGLQVLTRSVLAGTSPVVLADHDGLAAATAALTGERRYLAAVPTQLQRWMAAETDLAALRDFHAVLLGGAATPCDLVEGARAAGVAVVTTYGMSETCGGCVYDGVALDGVAVGLGAGGEISLAGPVLFDGYVDEPHLTAEVLWDGWLHTPDLGRLTGDGRLEVLGRADDVVISGGVNVSLPAVENRLTAMPGIEHCAVVGLPDPEWGTWVVAVLVPAATGSAPTLEAVRDFVSGVHPRSWAPRGLVVRDSLPLLESGKTDRQTLLGELDARR